MEHAITLGEYSSKYDIDSAFEYEGLIYVFTDGDDDYMVFDADTLDFVDCIGALSERIESIPDDKIKPIDINSFLKRKGA